MQPVLRVNCSAVLTLAFHPMVFIDVLPGIELREFSRTNGFDDEERFSELIELEESNTEPSTQIERSLHNNNRPLPPLPPPRERIPQISSGNPTLSYSDEPYYVEVLEHVDRPINVRSTVPKEPSTAKPIFKSHKDFEKLAAQGSSNLNVSDSASHVGSKPDTDEESPYCDNPSYFPDVETDDDCAHVVSVFNETADLEDPYTEVLESDEHIFTNQAIVRTIKHEQLTNKSELGTHQVIEKVSDLPSSNLNVMTMNDTVMPQNSRVDSTYGGRCRIGSPYDDEPCYFPHIAPAERVHDAYMCDKSSRVEPEKAVNKAGVKNEKTSILVTVSSDTLEFKVFRN